MPSTPYRLELAVRARDLGVSDHRLARSRPSRCRSAEVRTGASCLLRSSGAPCARSPTRTPTLCCTSIRTSSTRARCGRRCPRARLRGSGCSPPGRACSAIRAGGASQIGFVQLRRSSRSSATRRHMEKSSNATELVRDHFREKASSFDALYDEEHLLQRAVAPRAAEAPRFRDRRRPRVLGAARPRHRRRLGSRRRARARGGRRRVRQRRYRPGDARSLEGAAGAFRRQGQARPRRRS